MIRKHVEKYGDMWTLAEPFQLVRGKFVHKNCLGIRFEKDIQRRISNIADQACIQSALGQDGINE
jgi:hypothetical protein